jgi:hypothetical protein
MGEYGVILTGEALRPRRKFGPDATDVDANPGFRGEKPGTSRLSYGTAFYHTGWHYKTGSNALFIARYEASIPVFRWQYNRVAAEMNVLEISLWRFVLTIESREANLRGKTRMSLGARVVRTVCITYCRKDLGGWGPLASPFYLRLS